MEQQSGNGLGVAALVCGILGIVGSFIPIVCYFTLVLAILGIIFGVKARKMLDSELRETQTANYFSGLYPTDCAVPSANAWFCRKYCTLPVRVFI